MKSLDVHERSSTQVKAIQKGDDYSVAVWHNQRPHAWLVIMLRPMSLAIEPNTLLHFARLIDPLTVKRHFAAVDLERPYSRV